MNTHRFTYDKILEMARAKTIKKKEKIMIEALKEYIDIEEKFAYGESPSYINVPTYIIPTQEDTIEEYNNRLLGMYIFGCKRIILDVAKINEIFGTKYTDLERAKREKFGMLHELGFDVELKKAGRRIMGYKVTINKEKVNELQSNFDLENSLDII